MGDMFAVGGCDCTCNATSNQTVTLQGCNSFAFTAGQSIDVCTASGCATPITGSPFTTNSSGQISVPTGSHWFIPANGRFSGALYTVTTGTNTITFTAATGYICCANLWFPIPTTVHWSDGDISLQALTRNTGTSSWNNYSYSMNGTIAGCDSDPTPCCTSRTNHPYLTIAFGCYGPSRSWYEGICSGSVYLYETTVGCC